MSRIRTIKPEFGQDRRLALELTRDQRLFYALLWTDADDEGRFRADPRRLLGALLPYEQDLDESWVARTLDLLEKTHRCVLYAIDGELYGELLKFRKHQSIDRPSKSKIPPPQEVNGDSPNARRIVVEGSHQEQGTGNREQGKDANASSVREVFDYWINRTKRDAKKSQLTDGRRKVVTTRLKRFTVAELKTAIDGVLLSDYHRDKYDELTSIFQNDERVESHIKRARASPNGNGLPSGMHVTAQELFDSS